jgi:hypothetical protein
MTIRRHGKRQEDVECCTKPLSVIEIAQVIRSKDEGIIQLYITLRLSLSLSLCLCRYLCLCLCLCLYLCFFMRLCLCLFAG